MAQTTIQRKSKENVSLKHKTSSIEEVQSSQETNKKELLPLPNPNRLLIELIKQSQVKITQINTLREEIEKWFSEATDEPLIHSNGNRYILPPILNFKSQNNDFLMSNNLMGISLKDKKNHDHDDPFKNLLKKLPKFNFPRTKTGFNNILFGVRGEKFFKLGNNRTTLLEVDTRDESIVENSNKLTKEQIKPLTKDEEKELALLNAPLNFTRNPRFEEMESDIFRSELIAEPAEIIFNNYVPYNTYSTKLIIRNLSKHSHRFRVQYSSGNTFSDYFSFKLKESPTKDESLVASGLCCTYDISFTPNSLGSFNENLLVISETGTHFNIPIKAANNSPEITLPKDLDCGECRPGFSISTVFTFSNIGGYARYIIMKPEESKSAFELFDELGNKKGDESEVAIGKFTVSPGYFEINTNETIDLKITYSPTNKTLGELRIFDTETMVFACDQCSTSSFQLNGSTQNPKMQIIEGYFCDKDRAILPDTSVDLGDFDFKLDFLTGNPYAKDICFLTMKNPTRLKLKFRWAQCDYVDYVDMEESIFENPFECIPLSGVFEPW